MSELLVRDIDAQISADEAFARRLQADQHRVDSSTPLISSIWGSMRNGSGGGTMNRNANAQASPRRGRLDLEHAGVIQINAESEGTAEEPAARRNVRLNVMEDGARGMNASRLGLLLSIMVNVPLIIAGVVVLTIYWSDHDECDTMRRQRWRWWALISVVRMVMATPVVLVRWKLEGQREEERNAALDMMSKNIRASLDIMGLVWFIIGNMWLMQTSGCDNASNSAIYQLCLVYIIVTYINICLPCILLMLLVPVICFCLPCVIRVLAMMQWSQRRKGARQEEIEKLPLVRVSDMEGMMGEACPICLGEYSDDDSLRKLPCGHAFHAQCVDSWLVVNASCPSCRARCFETAVDDEEKAAENEDTGGHTRPEEAILV